MFDLTKIILEDAERVVSRLDLSPLEGKRVSVIGATGIIGTYVLACLKVYGKCAVFAVSSKPPEYGHPSLSFTNSWTYSNMVHPESHPTVPLADYIFFGAGYGQPAKFMARPLDTLRINTKGLFSTFSSLANEGRLLYMSSSEVYSGNERPPYREDQIGTTSPQHPRACYIEAKRCGEAICQAYTQSNAYNCKARVARVALSYGPGTRCDDDRAINQFIRQALLSGDVRLRDAGSANRTYCYVADTVGMLFNIWLHGWKDVYNVGGISHLTILDLAEMIGAYCGVPVWAPAPMVIGDTSAPNIVDMDINRVAVEFEMNEDEFVPMEVGLARTIEWQRLLYGKI